ncbi:phosphate ABC transporter membrane protein 1, PhoT family [Desulfacinum hydrothermale DSM 13146]|uniref:Phosphate ABC transporter membrane protein 1, PhoT family n=1 Tax=Desulfacinum hydrothermale DSM 13146 TaxID=1121390 RepID=A0A1W1XFL7_9BACT|nr:ABC transporter permease subunit [Desulfacinum hydrothermale]SMC22592.1 phosphate ABC transporter membrane protein 1, PhoT family [Desulfacinum hydrothermale DSM 13146]
MSRRERLVRKILGTATLCAAALPLSILIFMLILARPLLSSFSVSDLLTGSWAPLQGRYGILPMMVASFLLASCSLAVSFPVSLGCAGLIFGLTPPMLAVPLRRLVQLMTGFPTVVYGFVGVFLLVPTVRHLFHAGSGRCLLSALVPLSLMITPTMTLFFSDAFAAVPRPILLAAAAAGADPVQRFVWVVIPSARRGLAAGLVLSFGRALGDTLIALMLAGNAAQVPSGFLESARTLTAHIALVIAADLQSLEFASIFLCGMVLYVLTSCAALCAWKMRAATRKNSR